MPPLKRGAFLNTEEYLISVIENHAQLIRFVVRGDMTHFDAAKLSIKHANALRNTLRIEMEKDDDNERGK